MMQADLPEIGFMQGRLSPLIDGKIQSFPWPYWREEFGLAANYGFHLMEWTLDQDRLSENPLMTKEGAEEIRRLSAKHGITVASLTGDCFMQAPFYKAAGQAREQLLSNLEQILINSGSLGIKWVVLPLVDKGRLEDQHQEEALLADLERVKNILRDARVQLVFESDFSPEPLAAFIKRLDPEYFGINYDIGNSAALGYNHEEEIAAYGERILNVHVKDRLYGGGTVPLGQGAANIPGVLKSLKSAGYAGNYILQAARAPNGDHIGVLCKYRDLVKKWLNESR
ncbi:MAG: sugar phosphate isomerase/epimerase family protein [Desulfobaccales bacterium]